MDRDRLKKIILLSSAEYTLLTDLINDFLTEYPNEQDKEPIEEMKPIIVDLLQKGAISLKSFKNLDYDNAVTLSFDDAIQVLNNNENWQNRGVDQTLYFLFDEEY